VSKGSDFVTTLDDGRTFIACGHEADAILFVVRQPDGTDTDRIRLTPEQWEEVRSRIFDHGHGSAR
jgi:hypothetical protein